MWPIPVCVLMSFKEESAEISVFWSDKGIDDLPSDVINFLKTGKEVIQERFYIKR